MPVCVGPNCAIPLDRDYDHASGHADKLRAEADELLIAAQERADALRVQATEHERAAERERRLDDFPVCPNHQQTLSTQTAGDLIATRGAPAAVREQVKARAVVDLARGRFYGG